MTIKLDIARLIVVWEVVVMDLANIKFGSWGKIHELATTHVNKFSVYVSFGLDCTPGSHDEKIWEFVQSELEKIYGCGTDLFYEYCRDIIQSGLFFFDTEVEARKFYIIFEQELTDSSGIYSCLYSPVKGCLTENT
jgi:hypothetical protein